MNLTRRIRHALTRSHRWRRYATGADLTDGGFRIPVELQRCEGPDGCGATRREITRRAWREYIDLLGDEARIRPDVDATYRR